MVDAIIIGLVVANAILGYAIGLIWQVALMLTLIVGSIAAWLLSVPLAYVLSPLFDDPYVPRVLAFFLIFGMVSMTIRLIASVLRAYLERRQLQEHDRKVGLVFGIVNALVISMLVCTGYVLSRPTDRAVRESYVGSVLVRIGQRFVTDDAQEQVRKWLEQPPIPPEAIAPPPRDGEPQPEGSTDTRPPPPATDTAPESMTPSDIRR
jgi:uncharacterized membrane protein required for colicin V production